MYLVSLWNLVLFIYSVRLHPGAGALGVALWGGARGGRSVGQGAWWAFMINANCIQWCVFLFMKLKETRIRNIVKLKYTVACFRSKEPLFRQGKELNN